MTMSEEQIPRQVVSSIGTLIRRCPNCSGYGRRPPGGFDYEGPEDACKVCVPLREWVYVKFGIEFPVKL